MDTQLELPLSRTDRLALLRRADFSGAGSEKITRRMNANLHALLEQLEICGGSDGSNITVEVLAGRLHGIAPSTVREWLRAAERLGILAVEATLGRRRGGQGPNVYRVDWHAVRRFGFRGQGSEIRESGACERPSAPPSALAADPPPPEPASENFDENRAETMPGESRRAPSENRRAPSRNRRAYNKELIPVLVPELNPPPPLAPPSQPGLSLETSPWDGVVVELLNFGIQETERPIEAARGRGVTPAEVLAILAHARSMPGAWGPGAVRRRILNALPGQPAEQGWINPADTYRNRQAASQDAERAARERAAEREQAAEAAARKARNESLEAAYGPQLDGLTANEFAALLATVRASRRCPTGADPQNRGRGEKQKLWRWRLLQALADPADRPACPSPRKIAAESNEFG